VKPAPERVQVFLWLAGFFQARFYRGFGAGRFAWEKPTLKYPRFIT
jgi:hypothetical protein